MGKNIFNSVKLFKPKKNVFDLSHDVKLSCNMGQLVPTMALECVPGDKFHIGCESLLRFAPMVAPVMHRMDVSMHYFFVPNRILWDNWENFITQTKVGGLLPAFPTIQYEDGTSLLKLPDYMGIPKPLTGQSETFSALPFAAYQKIYNDYYRDENLVTEVDYKLIDGDNTANDVNLLALRLRAWEHDYFTASLPFAQKGDAVEIPVGPFGDVNVKYNVSSPDTLLSGTPNNIDVAAGTPIIEPGQPTVPPGGLYAETSEITAEAPTITDLRRAEALQQWLERNALGGTRYVENIYAHFGVKSSDQRLQRAEYITGTKSPVMVSEILNTTGTDTLPQGNMSGHGVSVTSGKYGKYFCEEHGYIIGIMSIMPKTCYQQGIAKHFLKTSDPFEYYWPKFAHIGEQAVQKREIFAYQGSAGDQTFGYVPRYAEYKFMPSRVAGDFRTTLDFWHLGRIFNSAPNLNQEFVECVPDKRIFAVISEDADALYAHVLHKIAAIRPMPKFGTPHL